MLRSTPNPRTAPRSEAFYLALAFAAILALLLLVLTVVAWRSPFMLFRLPERTTPPPLPAASSSALISPPSPVL